MADKPFKSSMAGRRATRPEVAPDELAFEETLRPRTLDEFAGQEKPKRNLAISMRRGLALLLTTSSTFGSSDIRWNRCCSASGRFGPA